MSKLEQATVLIHDLLDTTKDPAKGAYHHEALKARLRASAFLREQGITLNLENVKC